MSTARAGVFSQPPKVLIEPIKKDAKKKKKKDPIITAEELNKIMPVYTEEQKKYIKMWEEHPLYRIGSPGEDCVDIFLKEAVPEVGCTLIDWGCGPGRASLKLSEYGLDVTAVDFAFNCLDSGTPEILDPKDADGNPLLAPSGDPVKVIPAFPDIKAATKNNKKFRFVEHDITQPTELTATYGFCVDVMEHLPEEDIDAAIEVILGACRDVYFQIHTSPDLFGKRPEVVASFDGEIELHRSVFTYDWWLKKFVEHDVIIHRSASVSGACAFYLTGYSDGGLTWDGGHVNTDVEIVKSNIAENSKLLKKGAQNVRPHDVSLDVEIMVLAGGPTLNDFEDEIIEKRKAGMPLVTVNGSYNWALERGLSPSLQLVIDARDFNQRFTTLQGDLTSKTRFILAAQCHPSVFEGLPLDEDDRVWLWQVSMSPELELIVNENYGEKYKDYWPSPGGSTVMLRALPLLRMLGYHKLHIYGFDGCVFDGKYHHAYPQEENDGQGTLEIIVGGKTRFEKTFKCFYWMVFQAREFQEMCVRLLKDVDMIVYGDGMISYMIEASAKLSSGGEKLIVAEKGEVGTIAYAPIDRRGNAILNSPGFPSGLYNPPV